MTNFLLAHHNPRHIAELTDQDNHQTPALTRDVTVQRRGILVVSISTFQFEAWLCVRSDSTKNQIHQRYVRHAPTHSLTPPCQIPQPRQRELDERHFIPKQ